MHLPLNDILWQCIYLLCFRLKLVAARDGLLPSFLSGIHNDFYTPLPAVLIQVCTYAHNYHYVR